MTSNKKSDHVFFLEIEGKGKLSIAFCDSTKCDRHSAYMKINQVLTDKKIMSFKLNYLGQLDYSSMDEEIADQLDYFVKHEDVWILF
ncbi:hypothetical protein DCC39_18405 [Pueribacillus theae]|uniref:Uncharacterized protein n=1 Tax=Pueribacillus theae TaxID=2171751 RepID=A0A2U1JIX3_9BACI|nr:hypothetical protein [Pueribacillus theae]PWA05120.1 hypothetical protein DCC39_18405 [Pueribacillus theae]